jgi:7-cyano-7-deazaguanine synthase
MTRALVLFSGGQDSTSCLLWAKSYYKKVECISFDYDQIHNLELEAGERIAKLLEVDRILLKIPFIKDISVSSLLTKTESKEHPLNTDLPASFLPGRNLLFLTIAAMYAYTKNITTIIAGMCQTDYSGYPDCRRGVISTLGAVLSDGMNYDLEILTPLMYLTKAQSIHLIWESPHAVEALSLTHTCYLGEYPPCGTCPACILRAKGFKEAGLQDPLMLRAYNEFDLTEKE